jgi:hypothetical protein
MSSNHVFKKLPPTVQRELLRHVAPSKAQEAKSKAAVRLQQQQAGSNKNQNTYVLLGCFALIGGMGCVPLIVQKRMEPLHAKDGRLNGSQVRRGAFMNSGTIDGGRDENWDFENNRPKVVRTYADEEPVVLPNGRVLSSEDRKRLRDKALGN